MCVLDWKMKSYPANEFPGQFYDYTLPDSVSDWIHEHRLMISSHCTLSLSVQQQATALQISSKPTMTAALSVRTRDCYKSKDACILGVVVLPVVASHTVLRSLTWIA